MRYYIRHALLIALFALGGCGPKQALRPTAGDDQWFRKAETIEAGGNLERAANYYLKSADVDGEQREEALIRASKLYTRLENYEKAAFALKDVHYSRLRGNQPYLVDLLWAEIAVVNGAASDALALLTFPYQSLDRAGLVHYRKLRAEAFWQLRDYFSSARELALSYPHLENDLQRSENQNAIFQALQRSGVPEMDRTLRNGRADAYFRGWIEFTLSLRSALSNGLSTDQIVAQWRLRHPNHPAGQLFANQLVAQYEKRIDYANHIALLLPLKGSLGSAAEALLDGFLVAYFRDQRRPEIRVYSLDDGVEELGAAYDTAVREGAQWIVGPLIQAQVRFLAERGKLPVPVLALNKLPQELVSVPGLFQFSLNPEQDARTVAQQVYARSYASALVLVPEDQWGQRLLKAYIEGFEERGGKVRAIGKYNPVAVDHGRVLRRALRLDQSQLRHRQLQRILKTKIEFEEQPRDDIDVILLAAKPGQARAMTPQIRFNRASKFPVFATSHVNDSAADKESRRDLNGLEFCDGPWFLDYPGPFVDRKSIVQELKLDSGGSQRFLAMGMDAYRLLPHLFWLLEHPDDFVPGASGSLRVDANGVIRRDLSCARFANGQIVASASSDHR